MNNETQALYHVFSRHPSPKRLDGCPCCTDPLASQLLSTLPLHTLGPTELSHYATKAISTWGTQADFTYFLPRILELTYLKQLQSDTEVVLGKLGHADWENWPADEQKAVWEFVTAFWMHCIRSNDIEAADSVICGIASTTEDVSKLLSSTEAQAPTFRALYLHRCGRGDKQRLTNSFWVRSLPSYKQVLDWAYSNSG